jgi:hypothetical protein
MRPSFERKSTSSRRPLPSSRKNAFCARPRIENTTRKRTRTKRAPSANEEKGRQLQLEADRAELLKAQVAKLEQEAEQAKATAQAEMEKAEEAKRVAAELMRVDSCLELSY